MTTEPIRLVDHVGLSGEERSLLEAGRSRPPFDYDVNRGFTRFQATLAAAALTTVAATSAKAGSGLFARSALLAKLGTKVLVTVAVAAGAATAIHFASVRRAPSPARTASAVHSPTPAPKLIGAIATSASATSRDAPPTQPDAVGAPPTTKSESGFPAAPGEHHEAHRAKREGAPLAMSAEAAPAIPDIDVHLDDEGSASAPSESVIDRAASPASPPTPTPVPTAKAAVVPKTPPAPPKRAVKPSPSVVAAEIQGIAKARDLVSRDPRAALAVLSDLGKQYPNGYFVEERRALTILALAGAGDGAHAQSAATRFVRDYPEGPFTDRIRALAGTPRPRAP